MLDTNAATPFQDPPSALTILGDRPLIEDIEWLSRDEAIVTWSFANGAPVASVVIVEFDEQYIADGDAPRAVLDVVEAEAADRIDYDEDVDRDDGPGYADESHYGGAL